MNMQVSIILVCSMTMNIIMQMEKIYKNNNYGNYQN